ncbi:MAG: glucose-6-phosphate dehydrogenase, partial [Proteobacteria bacterium]|nr:glucose-6-phosphate dehydrogenase [Pseudomonadota bacterium]
MPPVDAFDMVIFGGTRDLAMRKLLPALYYLHRDSAECGHSRIIAVARQKLQREEYIATAAENCRKHIAGGVFDEEVWNAFSERIDYLSLDATDADGYRRLAGLLQDSAERIRVFYLATAPDFFVTICSNLAGNGRITPLTRVVLEKPLGRDLASAQLINEQVGAIFEERQIFRIDHYLGKETVQNLIALRFGNALFEPLWSRALVRDVQITLAEQVGAEGRGEFYDRTGTLRDMVQNHLLQLLCIVAMEPPASIDPDAVRDEKLKVLSSGYLTILS